MEESLHKLCKESPTVNKMSFKNLLSIAASQRWAVEICDVERAFLQSDQIKSGVFVKPPAELDLPREKVPKLNETAYSLAVASEALHLKQAKELKNSNFHPLKMDSTLFVHKPKGQTRWDAATAAHIEDSLSVRKKDAQQKIKEKLRFSSIEDQPFKFLGLNNRQSQYGELIEDC